MAGPLTGYRIIEIAGIGPGPFCAMLLSDMGADVVRIDRAERASGDASAPPPYYDVMGRGRRSLAIDLKNPDGVETVLKLVETADGLIEGFRPGVMERLGLGPEQCHARNPKLVFGRMTGWGQEGPYAAWSGHDINYIALAGCARAHRQRRRAPRAAAQPRRRLRRRRDVPRVRRRVRAPRRAEVRQWPGGRCGDGRRRRNPDVDVPWLLRHRDVERRTRHQPPRHWRALLRRVRMCRRPVRVDRVDRAAVLRRAHAHHGSRRRSRVRQADGSIRLASAEAAPARGVPHEDPRRVVRAHGAHRRVLRSRAHRRRSA